MDTIKLATIHVSGTKAVALDRVEIPAGIKGATVAFCYEDAIWSNLIRSVVFKGCVSASVFDAGEVVEVPAAVVAQKNATLRVGVCGMDSSGAVEVPTLWADLGTVRDSAAGDFPAPEERPLAMWEQVLLAIGSLSNLETEVKENLVAAINEVLSKAGTGGGNVDLTDYAKREELPTQISQLNNDAGFITRLVADLANYYTKDETFTREEINAKISAIPKFGVAVVSALPAENVSETTIYLLTTGNDTVDLYTEWIWTGGKWELLGSQRVDLSGYAKETWVEQLLTGYQPKGEYLTEAPVGSVNGKTGAVVLDAADVGALPSTYTPPDQTAEQVGADPKGTAAAAVSGHNTNTAAHEDIRLLIEGLTTRLNALANSTDVELDQMAELVAYIKANKKLIDSITTTKVSVADIVNNLATNVVNKPLSAAQGVALKALIDAITVPTKLSQLANDSGYLTDTVELSADEEGPVLGAELATANGWTTTGWTGDLANGFTHTSGNTNALSFTIPGIAVGKAYVIEFDCSVAYTNTNLLVTIGAAPAMLLYGISREGTKVGVIAADTGALTFTPESEFTGTISNISIREITAVSTPSQTIKDSNGNVLNEVRHIGENLFIGSSVGGKTVPPGMANMVNTAIGNGETFQNNISGFWNVAIGTDCMNGNVSGSRNVSVGANNLRNNVEGCRNVAIGNFALTQAKSAHRNVAIGCDCMSTATGGEENTAIGFQALYKNTTGYNNVAVGSNALLNNSTGLGNVALGYSAGSKITTGRNNVLIGYAAGDTLTTGNGNIIIGANADVTGGANYYVLNIGNLLKGSVQSGSAYLLVNGGLRLPSIGTAKTDNSDVYAEEWTFTLEDGSTVTKKVLMV